MKSTESDVCYFEVDAVFNREPVELLEESTWDAGLTRTANNTGEEVLGFLKFGNVFLSGSKYLFNGLFDCQRGLSST